ANGTWYRDSLGSTGREYALWRTAWRRTVFAMRSVPGAHFRFDWCINAAYRNIPMKAFYPGDDVVDIIGIDAYDGGLANVAPGRARWNRLFSQPLGLGAVRRFARAHKKPMS